MAPPLGTSGQFDIAPTAQSDVGVSDVEAAPVLHRTYATRAAAVVGAAVRYGISHKRRITESSMLGTLSDARYRARIRRFASHAPVLDFEQALLAGELRQRGVAVRRVTPPAAVVDAADAIVAGLRRRNVDDPFVKATREEMAAHPEAFLWGLSPQLLDVAEGYLGLPARYLGMEVKCERVNPSMVGVRNWHLDHEDRRMLKVIVYLSDVHNGTGPFGFIDSSSAERVRPLIRRQEDTITDDQMAMVVPREDWNRVAGPRLTAVHVDTAQTFHRVFPPTTQERYSVTFAYSSDKPHYTYSGLLLPRAVLRRLRSGLTERQLTALSLARF